MGPPPSDSGFCRQLKGEPGRLVVIVLVGHPESRPVRQVINNAVHCAAVGVVVIPGAPAHTGENVHGGLLVGHHAVRFGKLFAEFFVTVVARTVLSLAVVSGWMIKFVIH